MSLIYKYEHRELLVKLARLAREELHHFEQVLDIMHDVILIMPVNASRMHQNSESMYAPLNPLL